jgi:hypothetical protein
MSEDQDDEPIRRVVDDRGSPPLPEGTRVRVEPDRGNRAPEWTGTVRDDREGSHGRVLLVEPDDLRDDSPRRVRVNSVDPGRTAVFIIDVDD